MRKRTKGKECEKGSDRVSRSVSVENACDCSGLLLVQSVFLSIRVCRCIIFRHKGSLRILKMGDTQTHTHKHKHHCTDTDKNVKSKGDSRDHGCL